jgi:hypothetical protein
VQVEYVHCDIDEAWRRNLARGDDNISAWYTQPYHFRWLLAACGARGLGETPADAAPEMMSSPSERGPSWPA